jgi:hypothetical protein
MDDAQKNRLRTYAWSYFAYHADQRMKTFHFYLILVTAIVAGVVAAITKFDRENLRYLSGLWFLLTFVSVMFSWLEGRNRELVKNGEKALRHLDQLEGHVREKNVPHALEIFALDDYHTERKPKIPLVESHISYSDVLRRIFWTFGFGGFILGMVFLTL